MIGCARHKVRGTGIVGLCLVAVLAAGTPASGQQQAGVLRPGGVLDAAQLELEDLSPAFLGLYRKVMQIEHLIRVQTDRNGLDYDLARAVCLYESGGNAGLTSWAGAEGYYQVMPATRRLLGVDSNIEAGVKYLSQLVERFEREDYALAGYNGGPATVGRNRPMRLESLQYVLGVGHYRMMLKLYEEPIRRHASRLQLEVAREDDDWWSVSQRLGIPLMQLRLFNPYIGIRTLKPGYLIAYPEARRDDLYKITDEAIYYRSRVGDNYFGVGFAFDVELDALRDANSLWHLQTLPPGMELRLPLHWVAPEDDDAEEEDVEIVVHELEAGQTLEAVADMFETSEWRVIRDNFLWDEQLPAPGTTLEIRIEPVAPQFTEHTVRRGENLTVIANRYGTSVRAIQEANNMGTRTLLRVGQEILVPQTGR